MVGCRDVVVDVKQVLLRSLAVVILEIGFPFFCDQLLVLIFTRCLYLKKELLSNVERYEILVSSKNNGLSIWRLV